MSLQPILAIIGHPVDGNPSQYVLHQAFEEGNLDWRYITLDVAPEDLEDAVKGMRVMGFVGGNIANPHKEAVIAYLDTVTERAAASGSVNVFYREEERLVGDNTEGKAVIEAIGNPDPLMAKRIVLLGGGRVGRAVAFELATLADPPQDVLVVDRNIERAEAICALANEKCGATWHPEDAGEPLELGAEVGLLIQATSGADTRPNTPVPLEPASLHKGTIVVDVTLRPDRTWLASEAKSRGCRVIDGLTLLVIQEALNYRIWTNQEPNLDALREAAEEFLEF